MSQIIRGDEIQLFVENNSAPLFATSHTLTLSGNTVDVNTKDHGFWGAQSVGKVQWSLDGEFLLTTDDYDRFWDFMTKRRRIYVKWAKVNNYSENGLTTVGGDVTAWVPSPVARVGYAQVTSMTVNANTGENSTYSITLTGCGPLKVIDNSRTTYYVNVTFENAAGDDVKLYNRADYVMSTYYNDQKVDLVDNIFENVPAQNIATTAYLIGMSTNSNLYKGCDVARLTGLRGVGTIGTSTFEGCELLTTATLEGVDNVGDRAFYGCTSLANVGSTDAVARVGSYAFYNTAFTAINLGGVVPVTTIGAYAFACDEDNLRTLTINFGQETPPAIGTYAFGDPINTTILIPTGCDPAEWAATSAEWATYAQSIQTA